MTLEERNQSVRYLLDRLRKQIDGMTAGKSRDEVLLGEFGAVPVVERLTVLDTNALMQRLDSAVVALPPFPSSSGSRPGSAWHKLVGRTVRRDSQLVVQQLENVRREFSAALLGVCVEVSRSASELHQAMAQQALALQARIAIVSSRQEVLARQAVENAETVVSLIEALLRSSEFHPSFSNIEFGNRFRGTRDELLLRYHDVAELLLEGGGVVLDLGCGRGELVELVVSKGGVAKGVEVDGELVEFCRSIFLDVSLGNAEEALRQCQDDSVGGIALIQVVEHLSAQQLADLIPLAFQKLKVGGVLLAETPNATSPFVFTRSFYCDPTHSNPVHHEYLTFLLEQAGFGAVSVMWRSPVDESDKIPSLKSSRPEAAEMTALEVDIDQRIERINMFLFGAQDYLAIARKCLRVR